MSESKPIKIPKMNALAPPRLHRQWTIQMKCKHCGVMFQSHHSYSSLTNIQDQHIKERLRFVISSYCLDCGDCIIKHYEKMTQSFEKIHGHSKL